MDIATVDVFILEAGPHECLYFQMYYYTTNIYIALVLTMDQRKGSPFFLTCGMAAFNITRSVKLSAAVVSGPVSVNAPSQISPATNQSKAFVEAGASIALTCRAGNFIIGKGPLISCLMIRCLSCWYAECPNLRVQNSGCIYWGFIIGGTGPPINQMLCVLSPVHLQFA